MHCNRVIEIGLCSPLKSTLTLWDTYRHLKTKQSFWEMTARCERWVGHLPNSSNGKCNGKSTNENRVWSGRANNNGSCTVGDSTSNSIRVDPGIGTGADSKRKIHVSISFTSCITIDDVCSVAWLVSTVHTLSRPACREAPTLFGLDDSLHAPISFFRMKSVSRNVLKNGWCDSRHNDVNEWFRIFVRRRDARGDGDGLPSPDSESALGAVILKRVGWCSAEWTWPVGWWFGGGSESRRLGQSRSESLGATLLL